MTAKPRALRLPFSGERALVGGVTVLVAFLALYPVGALIYTSFRSAMPLEPGYLTLQNYVRVYTDPWVLQTIWNTALFAVGQTIFCVVLGSFMAWIVTRTNTPGRGAFEFLTLILFLMPPLLAVTAWSMLLSPSKGLINNLLVGNLGLESPPFNIYSILGMIWVQGLFLTPLAFLTVAPAFKAIDPALEESARMSGSGVFGTFLRVTVPVLRPAILSAALLMFIVGIGSFEVPQLLGSRDRLFVLTSEIFNALKADIPPDYSKASALGTGLLVISMIGVYLYNRATAAAGRFVTVKGKGYRAGIVDIGRWRFATATFCWVFFALTVFLPIAILFIGSLLQFYGRFDWTIFQRMSLKNYPLLLQHPGLLRGFTNSFSLAAIGAVICVLFASLIAFITIRTNIRGRKIMDNIAMLPISFPPMVLGLGLMWAYIVIPLPIYGTLLILAVAYVTRYIPSGLRTVSGAMIQIDKELEEASLLSGASWLYTFRTIILPLLRGTLGSVWLMLFLIIMNELSMSILLAGAGNPVLLVVLFDYYQSGDMGALSAAAVINLAAILSIVAFAQRVLKISVSFS